MNFVDIVIPYYNKSKYIERAVNSILTQPYDLVNRIIIVDDGSSKEEHEFLLKVFSKETKKIRVIRQRNQGLFKARIRGLSCCDAPFACFVDADDELYPNWSTVILPFLTSAPKSRAPIFVYEMCLHYKDYTDFDCKDKFVDQYNLWSKLVKDEVHFDHSACNKLIPRDVYYLILNNLSIGSLPTERLNFAEDVLFMAILMSIRDNYQYTDQVGYVYYKDAEGSILKTEKDVEPLRKYIKEISSYFKFSDSALKLIDNELNAILGGNNGSSTSL